MNRLRTLLLPLGCALLLGGCYEDASVTLHEPGVYKGKIDPLVAKTSSAEYQQTLEERFQMTQTDR